MEKGKKSILVFGMITAFITFGFFIPGPVCAGDLEPPPEAVDGNGEPVSTMVTLDEIYDKLEVIDGKIDPASAECEGAPIEKTGQTSCWDRWGDSIPCAGTGEDGDLQIGVDWPDPRFTDNGDGTVTDNLTGLMWMTNANATLFGLRTLSDALSDCAGCNEGSYTDWRLPNIKELQSLIDYGEYDPALPSVHPFTYVQSFYYHSSTTWAYGTSYAWIVDLSSGAVYLSNKGHLRYVWCVRGGN